MVNVIQNYLGQKTSFTVYDKPRNKIPTLTFCFMKYSLDGEFRQYEYGLDFVIEYIFEIDSNKKPSNGTKRLRGFLHEGDNFKEAFYHGKVNLMTLNTMKIYEDTLGPKNTPCYRISAFTDIIYRSRARRIQVYFNTTSNLPSLAIYITSEENALGLPIWQFRDGQMAMANIEKNELVKAFIKPIEHKFISKESECRKEPFMDCFENHYGIGLNAADCPKKCAPVTTSAFPLCTTDEEKLCAVNVGRNLFKNFTDPTSNMCPQPCNTLHYDLHIEKRLKYGYSRLSNPTFIFSYRFSAPEVVTVYQEYLIYDTISMVAYTGGILGMCIGFSFMNVITNVITFIQNMIRIIKFKFTNQNLRHEREIMNEVYLGTQLQSETEESIAQGQHGSSKQTLETKVEILEQQINRLQEMQNHNEYKQPLESKIKEQEEQMKKLQERLNILESK